MSPLGDVYKAALPSGLKAEDAYKPRTEVYVCLGKQFRGERELHIAFDSLARSAKQQKVLTTYLQLSGVAESPELASLDVIQSGENEDCKDKNRNARGAHERVSLHGSSITWCYRKRHLANLS